jgi:hypothetical protein
MAKTNFQYEKRQRELEKKRKAEEKARRKADAKSHRPSPEQGQGDEPGDVAEAGTHAETHE